MTTKVQASPENIACPEWLQNMTIEQMHEHYATWPQRQRTEWGRLGYNDDWGEPVYGRVHAEGPFKGEECDALFDEDLYNLVLQIHHATQQWKTLARINEPRLIPDKAERLNSIERHLMQFRLKALELSWYSDDRKEEHTQIKTALGVNHSTEFTINKEE